jgi:quercetin dioxygenase-like cupin family protein
MQETTFLGDVMARAGDVIENPASGERILFEKTGTETDGEYLAGKIFLAAHGVDPPEHVHPKIEERFRIVSGTLSARADGREQQWRVGQELVVPPGIPHTWWNDTDEEVVIEFRVSPALPLRSVLGERLRPRSSGESGCQGAPRTSVHVTGSAAVLGRASSRQAAVAHSKGRDGDSRIGRAPAWMSFGISVSLRAGHASKVIGEDDPRAHGQAVDVEGIEEREQ